MRKLLVSLLALALACGCVAGLAEGSAYSDYAGVYTFASGVGAWFTQLTVNSDGSFQGFYEDQDYGEGTLDGADYEWIVYNCRFSGRFSAPDYSDGQQLICRVEEMAFEPNAPHVEGDTRYEPQESCGLDAGDRLTFYRAGARRSSLPDGLISWLWYMLEDDQETVPFNTIYDETWDSGFGCELSGQQ